MTKLKFLLALEKELSVLPQNDIEERLTFYSEMIEDRVEEGLSEEEAVAQIGSVEEIAAHILAEYPVDGLNREIKTAKRKLKTWEIVLLIAGSPIWASLLLAAISVGLSLYVSFWAVVISLWAVFAALAACAVALPAAGVFFLFTGHTPSGLAVIGVGLVCAGLAIFCHFGCRWATKGAILLGKKVILALKRCFTRKEDAQ